MTTCCGDSRFAAASTTGGTAASAADFLGNRVVIDTCVITGNERGIWAFDEDQVHITQLLLHRQCQRRDLDLPVEQRADLEQQLRR
ncbi:MAG: hypothetical protein U1E76_14120 [Planctomycetota bacterium]